MKSHESIILLRGEVWTHKTSLSSPLFIGVPIPRKGSEWSCICVLMVSFTSFYDVSIGIWKCSDSVVFFGGNVRRVCSGIFCFSFYYSQIHDHSIPFLGTGTPIKSGELKLVLWVQTFTLFLTSWIKFENVFP
jgi:hypothetical protein